MSRIRYLDIDELNDRLSELEDLEEALENAQSEYDDCRSGDSPELDGLREKLDEAESNFSESERNELKALRELRDEVGSDGGKISTDGGPFIHCDDFEEYAQELAEETGAIDRANVNEWPFRCIDWSQAAKELESDYSVLTYGGEDYYYRA